MKRKNDIYDVVANLIPINGSVLMDSNNHNQPMILEEDIDGDYKKEIVAAYELYSIPHILIIKNVNNTWTKRVDIEGHGYGIRDMYCANVYNTHKKDIIIGWQISRRQGELNVYATQYNGVRRIAKDIVYNKIEMDSEDNLFVWEEGEKSAKWIQITPGNKIKMINRDTDIVPKEIKLFPASKSTIGGTVWGYINEAGEYVIKPQFDWAEEFQKNGLAVVDQGNLSGLINESGQYIVEPQYDNIGDFFESRAVVMDGKYFKMIDEQGNVLFTTDGYLGNMVNGRAVYGKTNEEHQWKYGYINQQGEIVITPQFQSARDFTDEGAVVQQQNGKYALIDRNGNVLQEYDYGYVGDISEGLLPFKETQDGLYGFINVEGDVIISPQYNSAQGFEQGRAIVSIEEENLYKYGLINTKGDYVISPKYNDIRYLGEKRVALGIPVDPNIPYQRFKYAIADLDGNKLTDFIYRDPMDYEKGYASVNTGDKTFFIDTSGKRAENLPVIPGTGTMSFVNNIIKANVDARISYLKRSGEIIWQQDQTVVLNDQYTVEEEKHKPNPDYLVYYPQIIGMNSQQAQRKVNKKLKDLAGVKDIPWDKNLDYSYTGDFSVEFFRNRLVVIKLVGYNYPFGAAHGMPSQIYAHVNLHTGVFYELPNLFKPNSNYVEVISDIIREQIVNQEEYSYIWLDSYKGIKPNQPFFVTADSLNIYFEPYEIAPYAAGFPTFTIPFEEIMNIINTKGAFWRSFH